MSKHGDKDKVVRDLPIQPVNDMHIRPLVCSVDDARVAPQLLQPRGPRARYHRDFVTTGSSELECEGTADSADTEYGDTQSGRRGALHFLAHAVSIIERLLVNLFRRYGFHIRRGSFRMYFRVGLVLQGYGEFEGIVSVPDRDVKC